MEVGAVKAKLYDIVEHKNGGFYEVIEEPNPVRQTYIVEDAGEFIGKPRVLDSSEGFDVILDADIVRVLPRKPLR
jgi:hypothetical protein